MQTGVLTLAFDLFDDFHTRYAIGSVPRLFHAPGRVNLIGEHTDYNGGLVLPCAIDRGTRLLMRRTESRGIKLSSNNFDLMAILSPEEIANKYGDHWINYPLGVIAQFAKRGYAVEGIECLYAGDVPNGAGLSSSASVTVVTAFAINALFGFKLSPLELVHIARGAENEFVGLACGIMDPYAIAMAQSGHAMALDCGTLSCEQVPLQLDGHHFVISNSNQRRELSESGYNTRFDECVDALSLVQESIDVRDLASVSEAQLETLAGKFASREHLFGRVRHVVSEQSRVVAAGQALHTGDLKQFGQLMCASHRSLAEDFEVSTHALDALVEAAMATSGVLGSRMTGAGFGGCTVSLVANDALDRFESEVAACYHSATGLTADFYRVSPADGAMELLT